MYFIRNRHFKIQHDCAIIDEAGETRLQLPGHFNMKVFPYKQLLDALDGQKKIGFESTGLWA